ncbi:hypothetical protein [Microcoleus sp. Pol12B5]|uniref:hypothetical protein n=1 Tax=Microcoleus sp. Pol12B5 TaxID=3055396 RepID=UPI002FD58187
MSESLIKQEFLTELESILESDETYGSNVQVLTYSVKKDVINGKFKDSWNKRVYEFVIDIDGISYKPAAKLDSFSIDELPVRFDAYSEGYLSLFKEDRLDGKLTGKRTKKPKCGNEGYGCGFSCIGLQKTCRILSSGKKAGTNQGKEIGKERLNKLLKLAQKALGAGDGTKFKALTATATNIAKTRSEYREKAANRVLQQKASKQSSLAPANGKVPTKNIETKLTETQSRPGELIIDQETFNIKFPPQEVARQYGIGGPVERARAVIDFVKDPKTFTSLNVGDQAGFLDNATTIHGVGDKNWDEQLERPMVANDPGRKLGAESSNVRAQGAKQIWDNLTPSQKSKVANELKQFKSRLAEKPIPGIISESDKFENRYVEELAVEIRKLIK